MARITFESLLKNSNVDDFGRGSARDCNVDKSSHFYHVMTRSWSHESIFNNETARYRQRILGRLCEMKGITIIFSVTMPNHTHEVFMAKKWADIAEAIRLTNSQVSRYLHNSKTKKLDKKIFDKYVLYVPIKDIGSLLYVGKYIFDNPQNLEYVPYSCFWMFKNSHPSAGYDVKIYQSLFNMDISDLMDLYSRKTKPEIKAIADRMAKSWTKEDTEAVFLVKEQNGGRQ